MQVAQTILEQLGGKQFIALTGSRNFASSKISKSLTMKLAKNKLRASNLQISLKDNDTYTLTFYSMVKYDIKIKATYSNVYCDQLQDIFTEATGLYTRL